MKIKSIFKKNKMGKEESDGGSEIIRHSKGEESTYYANGASYEEDIDDYFNQKYPDKETFTFVDPDNPMISVNLMSTIESVNIENDVHVLYTKGMSTLPMNRPKELPKEYKHLERAELFAVIPAIIPKEEILNGEYYWLSVVLNQLAGFVHAYDTWFSHGHTIPNGQDDNSYAPENQFTGSMLAFSDVVIAKDKVEITLLELIPLFTEEMNMKLDLGADELIKKLIDNNYSGVINDRINVGL